MGTIFERRREMGSGKTKKTVEYGRYGYMFIAPFFIAYFAFQLWPLLTTFYYSVCHYEIRNLKETVEFGTLANFVSILGLDGSNAYALKYFGNTVIMWLGNFIPQILLSLLLSAWLTNNKIQLKGAGAYKVLVYLPNVITAASISVLFNAMFSQYGPVTQELRNMGIIGEQFDFMKSVAGTRGLISFILFWMWYGNTTILLISGVMGISPSLFEAADIDGANGRQKFFKITLPLLKPILMYTLITSLIGGFQMYDIPALFNKKETGYIGMPDDTTTTVTMYIMRLYNSDTGKAAAVSVFLFIITVIASMIYFAVLGEKKDKGGR
jgi:multiple sugar transport system permease protein